MYTHNEIGFLYFTIQHEVHLLDDEENNLPKYLQPMKPKQQYYIKKKMMSHWRHFSYNKKI